MYLYSVLLLIAMYSYSVFLLIAVYQFLRISNPLFIHFFRGFPVPCLLRPPCIRYRLCIKWWIKSAPPPSQYNASSFLYSPLQILMINIQRQMPHFQYYPPPHWENQFTCIRVSVYESYAFRKVFQVLYYECHCRIYSKSAVCSNSTFSTRLTLQIYLLVICLNYMAFCIIWRFHLFLTGKLLMQMHGYQNIESQFEIWLVCKTSKHNYYYHKNT